MASSSLNCLRQRLGIGAPNAAANGMSDYIAGEELQLFQYADQSLKSHCPKAKIVQCISPKNYSILNKGFAELFSKATVTPVGRQTHLAY